jgi:uncharacterized protein YkwD
MKILILAVIIVIFAPVAVQAAEIRVTVDGEAVFFPDQAPANVDGRTLVPLRATFEHVGFRVGWESATRTVSLTRGSDELSIVIGAPVFTANGQTLALDVPAQIIGSSTMLPIRALMESVGYFVGWDSASRTVVITSEAVEIAPPAPQIIRIPDRRLTAEEISAWSAANRTAQDFENEVIRLVNIERANAGLSPVLQYETLMLAARFKAQSLVHLNYFSHTHPVYGHFSNISREVFNKPHRAMGEILARGQRSPEAVVRGWLDSPGHRGQILNPAYTRTGVGFYNYTWAQKFSS